MFAKYPRLFCQFPKRESQMWTRGNSHFKHIFKYGYCTLNFDIQKGFVPAVLNISYKMEVNFISTVENLVIYLQYKLI